MEPEHKYYKIKNLHFDERNPRVGRGVTTELEAAQRLLSKHGSTIRGLAKDIALHGLDPLAPWAVVREKGKLVVLEGNRRLMACRLLTDPKKANDPGMARSFARITRTVPLEKIESTRCVLFSRRADARHWIELKHHGLGSGEGTDSWGPEMVYIDQLNNGGSPEAWNEFWYWIEETYADDPEIREYLDDARDYQYTGMARVYKTSLPEKLQMELTEDGKLKVGADHRALRPFICALMKRMRKDGDINSRSINTADDADAVVNQLLRTEVTQSLFTDSPCDPSTSQRNVPDMEDPAESPAEGDNLDTDPGEEEKSTPTTKPSGGRGKPKPTKAETNLYGGVIALGGLPGRLKDLIGECKTIVIVDYPEIASVMARIGLELTLDAYIEKFNVTVTGRKQLFDKVKAVLQHLDPTYDSKSPNRKELTGIWGAIRHDLQDSGHLIKDLHDCVHSYEYTASLEIAQRANKILTPLMVAMTTELRQT